METSDRVALTRYRLRRALGRNAVLFRAAVLARPHQWRITVHRGTDLVIDGYPRSGNNFTFEAVTATNPGIAIASRTHAPAQLRRAVRLGLPTVVLVRDPAEAVLSTLVRQPYLTAPEALDDWTAFHDYCWALRDGMVVGEFRRVTSDLGSVIEAVNDRFGTSFVPYRNSEQADAEVHRAIEDHHRGFFGGRVDEAHVARPSAERDALKEQRRADLAAPGAAAALARAAEAYQRWAERAA